MFGLFTTKITAGDVARAVVFADSFVTRHSTMIPVPVLESWGALRAALLTWKDELTRMESRQ
jgi:hypothetical protein